MIGKYLFFYADQSKIINANVSWKFLIDIVYLLQIIFLKMNAIHKRGI